MNLSETSISILLRYVLNLSSSRHRFMLLSAKCVRSTVCKNKISSAKRKYCSSSLCNLLWLACLQCNSYILSINSTLLHLNRLIYIYLIDSLHTINWFYLQIVVQLWIRIQYRPLLITVMLFFHVFLTQYILDWPLDGALKKISTASTKPGGPPIPPPAFWLATTS